MSKSLCFWKTVVDAFGFKQEFEDISVSLFENNIILDSTMLNLFVTLLLVADVITASDEIGNTASDICSQTCNRQDSAFRDFPATNDDLQKFCESRIEFMECDLQQEETCRQRNLDKRVLQMRYRILATVREVCSEDTLLHAAVADNLECFGKLINESSIFRQCGRREPSDRVQKFVDALSEEGLVSLTENESPRHLYACIGGMNFFACQALIIERDCGTVAMDAFSQIIQKVKPLGAFFISCEETFHLLPAIIRLRKMGGINKT